MPSMPADGDSGPVDQWTMTQNTAYANIEMAIRTGSRAVDGSTTTT